MKATSNTALTTMVTSHVPGINIPKTTQCACGIVDTFHRIPRLGSFEDLKHPIGSGKHPQDLIDLTCCFDLLPVSWSIVSASLLGCGSHLQETRNEEAILAAQTKTGEPFIERPARVSARCEATSAFAAAVPTRPVPASPA